MEDNNISYKGIGPFSNELELCLDNVSAIDIIGKTELPLIHEVNRRDMVEMTVSMLPDTSTLNIAMENQVKRLQNIVENKGGRVLGGSAVLEDVNTLDLTNLPWYLYDLDVSESLKKGFLDIASQQTLIGIKDEKIGWEIYNAGRHLAPLLIGLTASSPYIFDKTQGLIDTKKQSSRPMKYASMFKYYPDIMWKTMPDIDSTDKFHKILEKKENSIKKYLSQKIIPDTNWNGLNAMHPSNKETYYERLFNDSDNRRRWFYWFMRPRLNHETISTGGDCFMSMEFRAPDLVPNVSYIQNVNRFIIGFSNYIANNYSSELIKESKFIGNDFFEQMLLTADNGLASKINGKTTGERIQIIGKYAIEGLTLANECSEAKKFKYFLEDLNENGNPADRMLRKFKNNTPTVNQLKDYYYSNWLQL